MSADDLSDEDKALFQREMAGVKPLGTVNTVTHPKSAHSPIRRPSIDFSDNFEIHCSAEAILSYLGPTTSKQMFKLLSQGRLSIDGTLDIHGFTLSAAKSAIIQFLQEAEQHRAEVVRIIHGKGIHSPNQRPLIKNALAHWLQSYPNCLAYHSAPKPQGGSGALDILLK